MYYEEMIRKALAQDRLKHCILGYGEYRIDSRNEAFTSLTDYDMLLCSLGWYNQKYPEQRLEQRWNDTLRQMLGSATASYIYCAAMCAAAALERSDGSSLELYGQDELIRTALAAIEEARQEILDFLNRLYSGQVISENYVNALTHRLKASL